MNSKHIGADMVFALPNAEIGMMDAEIAAKIMYAEEGCCKAPVKFFCFLPIFVKNSSAVCNSADCHAL